MKYPFDPTTLVTPGASPDPEVSSGPQRIKLREIAAKIASDTANVLVGAHVADYPITSYFLDANGDLTTFGAETSRLIGSDLAVGYEAEVLSLPPTLMLEIDNPGRYSLLGELYPAAEADAVTAPPVNAATMAWFDAFFAKLNALGYEYINSVSYEIIDFYMPPEWKQRDYLGRPGLSGWVPPSAFITPSNPEPLNYMVEVQKQFLTAAVAAGHAPRFQIGEPWWWDGAYSNGSPCLYDDFTRALYATETGLTPPTPWIESIYQPVAPDQVPYLTWLRDKLGASTNYIRDQVKAVFPTAEATLLFFTPQVLNLSSEVTNLVNFPINDWKYPAYDFMQIEDYDWIIASRLDLVPLTFDAARNILLYPQSVVHYFAGFVLNAQDYGIWKWAETAIRMAQEADMAYIYVWSYTQAIRDSILYDDLPPEPLNVPILNLPPNWSDPYHVIIEFKTEIIVSRSGKEQRRALRRTPRKSLEYSIALNGAAARQFNAALSAWQAGNFFTPEVTRNCVSTTPMADTALVMTVDELPGWMQLGTAVIIESGDELDGRIVDQISGNTVTFTTANADDDTRAWPIGTVVYPALFGRLVSPMPTRRQTSNVTEATVRFNVAPASEPPLLNPPVAEQTFNGVEVLTLRPNWSKPLDVERRFDSETIDYGWGKTQNFFPTDFSQRLMKATFLGKTRADAEKVVGTFIRMKGQRGVFYMPTYERDMEISPLASAGVNLRLSGTEIADWLSDDKVYRNIAIITRDKQIHCYSISAVAKITTIDTLLTLTTAVTSDVLANAAIVCWLPLCRFATDELTISWVTDSLAQFDLSIKSLRNDET